MADLPAGRELDALVAEKVMGLSLTWIDGEAWWRLGPMQEGGIQFGTRPPRYSTDIAAAWEVVEHMEKVHGYWLALEVEGGNMGTAEFRRVNSHYFSSSNGGTDAYRICLAALKAVNG